MQNEAKTVTNSLGFVNEKSKMPSDIGQINFHKGNIIIIFSIKINLDLNYFLKKRPVLL